MVIQVSSSSALTSPGLSSPTLSGFLPCRLCRLKTSRAPAKTGCQARPGLFSEWVSHPRKGAQVLQRGVGFLVGTGTPWWPWPVQPLRAPLPPPYPTALPLLGVPTTPDTLLPAGAKGEWRAGCTLLPFLVRNAYDSFVVGCGNSSHQRSMGHMGWSGVAHSEAWACGHSLHSLREDKGCRRAQVSSQVGGDEDERGALPHK